MAAEPFLVLPQAAAPYPGIVVVHEAFGLNDQIRGVCSRFAAQGYAALGVDLFQGRNRPVCIARMFIGAMRGNLYHSGVATFEDGPGAISRTTRSRRHPARGHRVLPRRIHRPHLGLHGESATGNRSLPRCRAQA